MSKETGLCETCRHRAESMERVQGWLSRGAEARGLPCDPTPRAECKDHEGYGRSGTKTECRDYEKLTPSVPQAQYDELLVRIAEAEDEASALRAAISRTLQENEPLTYGDDCPLWRLKKVMQGQYAAVEDMPSDNDRAFLLGERVASLNLGFVWLFTPHPELNGLTPKEACDAGHLEDVENIVAQLEKADRDRRTETV
jgi:hypothetical protein